MAEVCCAVIISFEDWLLSLYIPSLSLRFEIFSSYDMVKDFAPFRKTYLYLIY